MHAMRYLFFEYTHMYALSITEIRITKFTSREISFRHLVVPVNLIISI
uniref:Uncharacterized protein n=1 Tax=Ascaris lumbricoides TaxID=6252 RepID=A0A0M3IPS7_ASCLU